MYKSFDFSWNFSWRRSFSKLITNSSSEIKSGRKQHLNGSVCMMHPFSEQDKNKRSLINQKDVHLKLAGTWWWTGRKKHCVHKLPCFTQLIWFVFFFATYCHTMGICLQVRPASHVNFELMYTPFFRITQHIIIIAVVQSEHVLP